MEIVGNIKFQNRLLPVYQSLDEPLFKASDVADLIDYSAGNVWNITQMCEEDEVLTLPLVVAGQSRKVTFVTETGLYNILSQSRKALARAWRRVVHEQLISLRRIANKTVVDQFDEWDHAADSIYFDEETGQLMRSITVAGGDVEQVPYISERRSNT